MALMHARSQNLIANPGFEDVNICVEFRAPCTPAAWESVAPEAKKLEYVYHTFPTGGNNLVRLTSTSPFPLRNYAQTQLLCPLEKGRQYRVSLLAATEDQEIPEIDLRFDTGWTYRMQATSLSDLKPTLRTGEKDVIKKIPGSKTFYLLQQNFTATDTFTHVVIGCFHDAKHRYDIGYLLIDSISIEPVDPGALCANAVKVKERLYAQHYRHTVPDIYYHALQNTRKKKTAEKMDCLTITVKDESIFSAAGRAREPEAAARLDSIIRRYDGEMTMKVRITGHAYVEGTANYNKVISTEKARRIADILVYKHGFSYDDIAYSGTGKQAPRYDPTTPEGRELNNFVDLEFCVPKSAIVQQVPVPVAPDTLVIPDVLFKFNSDELNTKLYGTLDSLIGKIPRGEAIQLQLLGHTDNVGGDDYNLDLSRRRARSVADYLRQKGLEQYIRHVSGAGESSPVATNDTTEGRKKNRRVEIIIYKGTD